MKKRYLDLAIKNFNSRENVSLIYDKEIDYLFVHPNEEMFVLMNSVNALDYIQIFMKKDNDENEMRDIVKSDIDYILDMFDLRIEVECG